MGLGSARVWGIPRLANANNNDQYTGIALATVISSAPLLSIQIVVNIE